MSFVSRMAWGLEGFGYVGSVLKIIHLSAQVGKTGVQKKGTKSAVTQCQWMQELPGQSFC